MAPRSNLPLVIGALWVAEVTGSFETAMILAALKKLIEDFGNPAMVTKPPAMSAKRPPPRAASQPPSGPAKTELIFDGSFASPAKVAVKPSPASVHSGACISSEKTTVICSALIATSALTAPPIAMVRSEKLRTAISGLGLARLARHHQSVSSIPAPSATSGSGLPQPQSLPMLK